jgi:son of sevenless-like protein
MAENPIVLCRVRALYPFQSTDHSSLCFKKGDFIEVLAQLETGWWDGWCDGNRGWFPSNYVEVVDDDELVWRLFVFMIKEQDSMFIYDVSFVTVAAFTFYYTQCPSESRSRQSRFTI